jgi:hypothetical protein
MDGHDSSCNSSKIFVTSRLSCGLSAIKPATLLYENPHPEPTVPEKRKGCPSLPRRAVGSRF